MKEELRNYKSRFRDLVTEKGIEWLIEQVPEVKKKKAVVCADYQRVKPSTAARWHNCTVQNLYQVCPCRVKK